MQMSRDGYSADLYNNHLIIFGGDRHLMALNDLYFLNLDMAL